MINQRKICIVTGTRAEYGLLSHLMKLVQQDPTAELQVIATGMHLSPEYGLTYQSIEADGLPIHAKVEMLLSSDSPVGVTKSIGLGIIGFADALDRLKPDIMVVLGDRFEIFAAVQAALVARIPVAHIHGGELSEGVIDDPIRHSITKMAHLHFVAADSYRDRVIQLGEDPDRVITVGPMAADAVRQLSLMDRKETEQSLGLQFKEHNFLVTYHPVTLYAKSPEKSMTELLIALDGFPDAQIIFTRPNSDTDSRIISRMIDDFCTQNPDRAAVYTSLGQLRYLSTMQYVDAVVGNSSSGLIEAPILGIPTVDIGDRQRGRIRAESVIHCEEDAGSILGALRQAMTLQFRNNAAENAHRVQSASPSERILSVIKSISLSELVVKRFHDLPRA